jgi:hypothetical protein
MVLVREDPWELANKGAIGTEVNDRLMVDGSQLQEQERSPPDLEIDHLPGPEF